MEFLRSFLGRHFVQPAKRDGFVVTHPTRTTTLRRLHFVWKTKVPWLKVGCFLRLERFSYDLEKWFRQVFVICFIQPIDEKIIDKPIKSLYCRSFVVSVLFASFHLKVIRKSRYLAFCCLPFSLVESSTAKPTVTMLSFVWGRNAQSWCHLIPEEPSSPGNFM